MTTKTYILASIRLTLVLLVLFAAIYPALITGIAKAAPAQGKGVTVSHKGKVVGYEEIGQQFTDDKYFQGRPSAVDYNAAGSGGSNKGPSNPEYLATVQGRIDSFLVHNPGIPKADIPADIVTASGSGLDPDISIEAARIQVPRIAKVRNLNPAEVNALIEELKEAPWLGLFGPEKVNVLKLNMGLDGLAPR